MKDLKWLLLGIPLDLLSFGLLGWVITLLYRWFVMPLGNMPEISIWQAVGISLFAQIIIPRFNLPDPDVVLNMRILLEGKTRVIGSYMGMLLMSWIVHFFV